MEFTFNPDVHSQTFRRFVRVPLLMAVAGFALLAQPPPPTTASPIPTDSPLLFRLFFGFHLDFDNWLAARKIV